MDEKTLCKQATVNILYPWQQLKNTSFDVAAAQKVTTVEEVLRVLPHSAFR
ncbi:hypothetical protein [Nostoc sp.]|uniref:hypothetical protein n=1 Tax=Nostoc sp. TaxID=1180 RepID=UPI002FF2DC8E